MEGTHVNLEREISDLKEELEHFQQEKERVRGIIGKIGGVPKFHTKLIDAIFITVITASVVVSIVAGDRLRLLMVEVATVSLSLKIIYLIHCEMRINHFEFWILSSIEWRINEMMKQIRQLNENK